MTRPACAHRCRYLDSAPDWLSCNRDGSWKKQPCQEIFQSSLPMRENEPLDPGERVAMWFVYVGTVAWAITGIMAVFLAGSYIFEKAVTLFK